MLTRADPARDNIAERIARVLRRVMMPDVPTPAVADPDDRTPAAALPDLPTPAAVAPKLRRVVAVPALPTPAVAVPDLLTPAVTSPLQLGITRSGRGHGDGGGDGSDGDGDTSSSSYGSSQNNVQSAATDVRAGFGVTAHARLLGGCILVTVLIVCFM